MELLKDDTIPYYSYVVFGNNCELKNIQLTSGRHHVTYALYLRKDIEYHAQCTGIQRTARQAGSSTGKPDGANFLGLLELSTLSFYLSGIIDSAHRTLRCAFFAQFLAKCVGILGKYHG